VLQREHVDAVAHAARLQQQYTALAADPCATHHGHAFFFGGQGNCVNFGVCFAEFDKTFVPRIGHVCHLPHISGFEVLEDCFRPVD
jgi:hypothetical protein